MSHTVASIGLRRRNPQKTEKKNRVSATVKSVMNTRYGRGTRT